MKEILKRDGVKLAELSTLAREIFNTINSKVVVLNGEMGAGKTTFMIALCEALGVQGDISSPTFSIVNEYKLPSGEALYHFDCYRIKDDHEALDVGFEDYLYSGNYCFIEWPSRVVNLLPDVLTEIEIIVKDDYLRDIVVREHGKR